MSELDNDLSKGAVESETPQQHSQSSCQGQLPHRPQDSRIEGHDTDFPEPGENPEHNRQDVDRDIRQNQQRNDKKDDARVA